MKGIAVGSVKRGVPLLGPMRPEDERALTAPQREAREAFAGITVDVRRQRRREVREFHFEWNRFSREQAERKDDVEFAGTVRDAFRRFLLEPVVDVQGRSYGPVLEAVHGVSVVFPDGSTQEIDKLRGEELVEMLDELDLLELVTTACMRAQDPLEREKN